MKRQSLQIQMPETAFIVWLHLVGIGLLSPLRRIPFTFRCLVGLPIGVVIYVTAGWLTNMLGISFSLWSLAVLVTGAAIGVHIFFHKGSFATGRELAVLAASLGLTVLTSIIAQALDLTKVSLDSLRMIEMASALSQGELIRNLPAGHLFARPLFLPLAHTPALELTGGFYLQALTPALGVTSLASFGWLTNEILLENHVNRLEARWLSLIAVVAVGTTYLVVFQLFYVNGHLAFAFYFFLLVGSGWLAATRGEPQWIILAIPAVIGLVLLRLEGPIVAVLALTPIVVSQRLSFAARAAVAATFAAVVLATFGTFLVIGRQVGHLDDLSIMGTMAAAVFLGILLLISRWFPDLWLTRFSPWIVLAGIFLVTAAMTYQRPDHMSRSAAALVENITRAGQWGVTWIGLSVLIVLATLVFRSQFPAFWVVPVIGFFPLLFALVYFRGGYRVGWGDSANRMLTHVLLVAVVYVLLSIGGALSPEDRRPNLRFRALSWDEASLLGHVDVANAEGDEECSGGEIGDIG